MSSTEKSEWVRAAATEIYEKFIEWKAFDPAKDDRIAAIIAEHAEGHAQALAQPELVEARQTSSIPETIQGAKLPGLHDDECDHQIMPPIQISTKLIRRMIGAPRLDVFPSANLRLALR